MRESGNRAPATDPDDRASNVSEDQRQKTPIKTGALQTAMALIESGKLSLSPEPMSLAEVLADCQAMIEPQAHQSGIRVRFPVLDGPCLVHADRTRVKQVLVNLLSNAIKYNRVGGRVDVRCTAAARERTRISLPDTGEGLAADKLAQLFQPFNRPRDIENGKQAGFFRYLTKPIKVGELMDTIDLALAGALAANLGASP